MTIRRRLAQLAALGLTTAALPAAGPAPAAHALIVPIPMGVVIFSGPTSHEVCAYGQAISATNRWEVVVTGARYYDTFGPDAVGEASSLIDLRRSYDTPSFATVPRIVIPHDGASAGYFQVTLAYAGTGIDFAGALASEGYWAGGISSGSGANLGMSPATPCAS